MSDVDPYDALIPSKSSDPYDALIPKAPAAIGANVGALAGNIGNSGLKPLNPFATQGVTVENYKPVVTVPGQNQARPDLVAKAQAQEAYVRRLDRDYGPSPELTQARIDLSNIYQALGKTGTGTASAQIPEIAMNGAKAPKPVIPEIQKGNPNAPIPGSLLDRVNKGLPPAPVANLGPETPQQTADYAQQSQEALGEMLKGAAENESVGGVHIPLGPLKDTATVAARPIGNTLTMLANAPVQAQFIGEALKDPKGTGQKFIDSITPLWDSKADPETRIQAGINVALMASMVHEIGGGFLDNLNINPSIFDHAINQAATELHGAPQTPEVTQALQHLGGINASQVQSPTQVHGDVRTPTVQSPEQVPAEIGGEGVLENQGKGTAQQSQEAQVKAPVSPAETPHTAPPVETPETLGVPEESKFQPTDVASSSLFGLGDLLKDEVGPAFQKIKDWGGDVTDSFKRVFNPAARGEAAATTAETLRAGMGKEGQQNAVVQEATKKLLGAFNRIPEDARLQFWNDYENHKPLPTPEMQQAADIIRGINDDNLARAQEEDPNLEGIEDYLAHLWEGKGTEGRTSPRPIGGPTGFLKQRVFPTLQDGLDAGYKPVTTNPVEATLMRTAQVNKWLMRQSALRELSDMGLTSKTEQPGFVRVGSSGWYADPAAAQVLENHLSPGLGNNAIYTSIRGVNNELNAAQLGLSAFHYLTEGGVTAASKLSNAFDRALIGDFKGAFGQLIQTPLAPITEAFRGGKILRDYKAGNADNVMQALKEGGFQVGLNQADRTRVTQGMFDAFAKRNVSGAIGGTLRMPRAIIEQISRPLFDAYIPRVKTAAAMDMMATELKRLGPDATQAQIRKSAASVVDSIDNRFGEMNYENLFMNRAAKDLLQVGLRAPGWTIGNVRETLAGPTADLLTTRSRVVAGGKLLTSRQTFTAAALATMVTGNALYQYLNGHGLPKNLSELKNPKGPDGKQMQMPSVMNDAFNLVEHPIKTLHGKASPLEHVAESVITNKEGYKPILNPKAPPIENVKSGAKFAAKQFLPISAQQRMKGQSIAQSLSGIRPVQTSQPKPRKTNAWGKF